MNPIRVFDGHCDTILSLNERKETLYDNNCHVSLKRAEKLGGYAQYFAFFTTRGPEPASEYFLRLYPYLIAQLQNAQDKARLCADAVQAQQAVGEGKTAILLSIEGAEAIDCDPGKLEWARSLGVSMIGLTWNDENPLAGSHLTGGGLTDQGREFVKRAQELGMVVDVSHISEQAFWDICDIATKPIVASHSNSKALCPHSRNLTDAQFLAIADLGGTAGLNQYSAFLGQEPVTLDTLRRHLEHFMELAPEHVALGGDWDGCDSLPQGVDGIDAYVDLYRHLERHGWPQQALQNVYFENLMKVVRRCTISAQETTPCAIRPRRPLPRD